MQFCIGLMKRSFRILQTLCLKLKKIFSYRNIWFIELYLAWPMMWVQFFFSQQTLNTFWIDLNYFRFGRYHQLIWIVLARVCAIFWMTYMVMPLPFWFLFISQKISYIICTTYYLYSCFQKLFLTSIDILCVTMCVYYFKHMYGKSTIVIKSTLVTILSS